MKKVVNLKRIYIFVIVVLIGTSSLFSQENLPTDSRGEGYEYIDLNPYRFISAGIGIGTRYGGLGGEIQWRATKAFGLSVAVGSRFHPLLSYALTTSQIEKMVDECKEWHDSVPFTNKTLKGLSFNAGINFWKKNFYIGLHYAQFGRWVSHYDEKTRILHGFLLSFGGNISLGKLPIAITVGGSFGYSFSKDPYMAYLAGSERNEYGGNNRIFFTILPSFDFGVVYKFRY